MPLKLAVPFLPEYCNTISEFYPITHVGDFWHHVLNCQHSTGQFPPSLLARASSDTSYHLLLRKILHDTLRGMDKKN